MPGNFFNLANSIAGSNNVPLDQIGQGYGNPFAQSPYGQLAGFLQGQPMQNNQAGGGPQNSNYAGIFPGGAAGPPANPPAMGALAGYGAGPPANPPAFGNANVPGITSAPGSAASTPTQPSANPPASGAPFGYGQPPGMMGRGSNAAGFGGLGAMFAGQHPGLGARYWSRLNNIGGA